ncbi:MAG TPA: aminotransferase class I/II-fold pyridoxal phosphate-dependent enzyme [Kofleriaceae bacterium]|nr:aminotransferase class I/II-fold pyridoxal phosphate-dependent enzyme [Kofleriaceae bacterium]
MLDFTSSLFLGLTHESGALEWSELTTGKPAALCLPAAATETARAFAALVGCARAVPSTSTLHAFTDVFAGVGASHATSALLYDDGVYPVARWGMERAERRGAIVLPFRHHDAGALERRLSRLAGARRRPWVVCDGFCPGCARPAPLPEYLALARRWGGRLVVDDTQATGLLGAGPCAAAPLGRGGGGSPARFGLTGGDLVVVASLAKAFGAPVAMLAGSRAFVDDFEARSETMLHCSPPSQAHLAAAARALALNAAAGDRLRARLVARVRGFRRALAAAGFTARGGPFPMQRVATGDPRAALALRAELARRGIRALARRARCTGEASVTFIITARHGEAELRTAAAALAAAAWGGHGSIDTLSSKLEA